MRIKFSLFSTGLLLAMLIPVTASAQDTTTYEYDTQGHLTSVDDSLIGEIIYDYDDAHNLIDRNVIIRPSCNHMDTSSRAVGKYLYPLTSCTDPEGDPLIITGATLTSGSATVTYTSARIDFRNFNPSYASLSYTVSDGNGGTATGTIGVDYIASNRR